VHQAEGTKGLFLLHAVFRLLESMESHGRYQDGHLHFAVRIGNFTQGVGVEKGGKSPGSKPGQSWDTHPRRAVVTETCDTGSVARGSLLVLKI
jgi:hypothetical protein